MKPVSAGRGVDITRGIPVQSCFLSPLSQYENILLMIHIDSLRHFHLCCESEWLSTVASIHALVTHIAMQFLQGLAMTCIHQFAQSKQWPQVHNVLTMARKHNMQTRNLLPIYQKVPHVAVRDTGIPTDKHACMSESHVRCVIVCDPMQTKCRECGADGAYVKIRKDGATTVQLRSIKRVPPPPLYKLRP